MKKFLHAIVLLLIVTSVHADDYVCNEIGLRINEDKALYGNRELVRCGKVGVTVLYAESCEQKTAMKFSLLFDEIANNIIVMNNGTERLHLCSKKRM